MLQKNLRGAPESALPGTHGNGAMHSIHPIPLNPEEASPLQHDAPVRAKRVSGGSVAARSLHHLPFLLTLIAIALVALVTVFSPQRLAWNAWAYSEWLINYDAGFIRRGLSGSLIQLTGVVPALAVVNLVVFVAFSAFCLLFWWVLSRSARSAAWAVILAIMLPNGPLQMAAGNEIFYRKEIVFHVALGVSCILYQRIVHASTDARRAALSWMFFVLFLAQTVLFPLFHEVYLFLSFPASWLLARQIAALQPQRRTFGRLVTATLIISFAMMVVCAVFPGNQAVAEHIWSSLSAADRMSISPSAPDTPIGGVAAIGWSLLKNLTVVGDIAMSSQYWIWGFAAVGIGAVLALITSLRRREGESESVATGLLRRHLAQLWFLFLASTPMYVLGSDWARWMSAVAISYLFLSFADSTGAVRPPQLLQLVPRRWRAGLESARDYCAGHLVPAISAVSSRHKVGLIALAFFYCLTFRPPECCMKGGYNPLYRVKPALAQLAHLRHP